jgi:alpha-L-arabinofuranosidase
MGKTFSLNVLVEKELHTVSPALFGVFLEDINFSIDGGLNANGVNNGSFDGVYVSQKGRGLLGLLRTFVFKPEQRAVHDRLRYWHFNGKALESCHEDPAAENSWYARLYVDGPCRLVNLGFNGLKHHPTACAISILAGQRYTFSCWVRGHYQGSVIVSVVDENGAALTGKAQILPPEQWQEVSVTLPGQETGYGQLRIMFEGQGSVDLDGIRLMCTDVWGQDDPHWSQGKLRRDLVETLRDLQPRFMRFPGGCIVEGHGPGNEYHWKDTVGPVINRRGNYNLWGALVKDGGYFQSYEIGFYEYFLLCEDLGMEPLPTLFAGINCQVRGQHRLPTHSIAFQEEVVQNYLDLIEYANGDPHTNPWARLRAEAGHPQPFGLKYIGIGNENFGEDYLEKFAVIKRAIDDRYPGMICVLSSGMSPQGKEFDLAWCAARERYPDINVDEHCYDRPKWFVEGFHRYDSYPREGAKVYMGEYAANMPLNLPLVSLKPNCYQTALAEAVFLAGIERNSDVVVMSSYAPLLSLAEGEQWAHNLINFNPAHVLRTANYYVQQLFSTRLGDQVVALEGELPSGVFASATTTLDRLYLKLINTNAHTVQAALGLPGIPDGPIYVDYLQHDDLKAANALDFHGTPRYRVTPQRMEMALRGGRAKLTMARYGLYVLTITRAHLSN